MFPHVPSSNPAPRPLSKRIRYPTVRRGTVPLFVSGLPGGPELVVPLLMLTMYVVLPVLGIIVYNFLDGKRGYEERITRLERRVTELEGEGE
ncbi:hypothetical protein [Halopelagius fulvigenes]|uniref:CcmD family protein n=1 Tax=Halopelagius fulvigenes TaxID=1198324 RepID=A0ABD5U0V0_9EURY